MTGLQKYINNNLFCVIHFNEIIKAIKSIKI